MSPHRKPHLADTVTTVVEATADPQWRDAAALLHEYVAWMRTSTGFDPFAVQPDFAEEIGDLSNGYGGRDKRLFVAYLGSEAIGTIAVRLHRDGSGELKRMYVRPAARGLGVADTLIGTAISHAAGRRCHHVWLESVSGPMDAAIAVYARNGFEFADDLQATLDIPGLVIMRRELAHPSYVSTFSAAGPRNSNPVSST